MFRSPQSASHIQPHSERAQFQKTVLENGIRVVTERIPWVRSASLGVWAEVGSRDESASWNGITHFLEHMVFKGTENRSITDIARSVESLGGYLNAFTTKEHTCFYARVLDLHINQAMDVLSDLVQHATFRRQELEKEKLVVIEELKNAEDSPEDIIHDYFDKALFPRHPLGFPIIGTEENLRRFRQDDLRSYVSRHYRSDRMVVAVAGNVEHSAVVKLVERFFRSVPAGGGPLRRSPGPTKSAKRVLAEFARPINQAHICLGTIAYGIRHRERYPLLVMNALLGEGMSSRLHQVIREKHGLAYTVYSYLNMLSDTGVFAAYLGTDRKNIGNATELVYRELERLKTKLVSRAELARTKSQIKGTMMLGLENMSSRMMRLGSSELYFGTFATLDEILKKIDAVTPDAIHHVANRLFRQQELSTVIIRPS
jgi:predicted Zn-dependent peptidase